MPPWPGQGWPIAGGVAAGVDVAAVALRVRLAGVWVVGTFHSIDRRGGAGWSGLFPKGQYLVNAQRELFCNNERPRTSTNVYGLLWTQFTQAKDRYVPKTV
jgi:hypothetical protein